MTRPTRPAARCRRASTRTTSMAGACHAAPSAPRQHPALLSARSAQPADRRALCAACGSTVLAVAGPDYAIVAGDTRMSTGFSIKSRNVSKIFQMYAGCLPFHAPQHRARDRRQQRSRQTAHTPAPHTPPHTLSALTTLWHALALPLPVTPRSCSAPAASLATARRCGSC